MLLLAVTCVGQTPRGTTSGVVSGGDSITLALPSGTASGDLAVVQGETDFAFTGCSSGGNTWANLYSDGSVPYISGAVFYRTLNAADVTAGSVVCSSSNSSAIIVAFLTSFAGTFYVNVAHDRGGGGGSIAGKSISSTGAAKLLYFTGNRNDGASSPGTVGVSRGTIVGSALSNTGKNVVGALYSESVTAGSYTPTYSYSPVGNAYVLNEVSVSASQPVPTVFFTTQHTAYVVGTPVIFQAYVSPTAATGTITFKDGATSLGTCSMGALAATGDAGSSPTHKGCEATYTLAQGAHALTAVYSGDGSYASATSASYANIVSPVATSPQPCSAIGLGLNASLNGFVPAPNDAYHQRIDGLPADANSAAAISELSAHIGSGNGPHLDFSGTKYGLSGIPYYGASSVLVPGLSFAVANNAGEYYPADSDIMTTWPGSANTMWIENHLLSPLIDPNVGTITGDNHMIVLDRDTCISYELYHAEQKLGQYPALTASNSAMWDMSSTAAPQQRAVTQTSADAAGLPLFEGLVTYSEAASGTISHATRMTTDQIACDHFSTGDCMMAFFAPLTHASRVGLSANMVYGLRMRIKASYDCTAFASAINRTICTSWKQYGVILADLGSPFYVSGTPDARWDEDDLLLLQGIAVGNWEVVENPTQQAQDRFYNGTAASISSFAASSTTIPFGSCTTLTASLANAPSYSVIDAIGFFTGTSKALTVCPRSTTAYNLTTSNASIVPDPGGGDGHRNTASVTVSVTGIPLFSGNTALQNVARH